MIKSDDFRDVRPQFCFVRPRCVLVGHMSFQVKKIICSPATVILVCCHQDSKVTATIPKNSAWLVNLLDFTIPYDSVQHYDKYLSVIVYNIRGKIADL